LEIFGQPPAGFDRDAAPLAERLTLRAQQPRLGDELPM
jgi:hypothetical protein